MTLARDWSFLMPAKDMPVPGAKVAGFCSQALKLSGVQGLPALLATALE